MGCDIHTHVEVRREGRWQYADGAIVTPLDQWSDPSEPFEWRDYGMFGFLADVRNYSHVPVISEPRGLPPDLSADVLGRYGDGVDWHSASWLTLAELLAYDYDQVFWDRRIEKVISRDARGVTTIDGAALAEEGEGKYLSLRSFLGDLFFTHLEDLRKLGNPKDVRVVFWFDN